jgi:hypothetical protein
VARNPNATAKNLKTVKIFNCTHNFTGSKTFDIGIFLGLLLDILGLHDPAFASLPVAPYLSNTKNVETIAKLF